MTRKTWAFALISITAAGGIAVAQPAPAGDAIPPQPPALPRQETVPVETSTGRPEGISIGIGIGYVLPTSIQTPNTTSVRLRLKNGLTFEPQLTLATDRDTREIDGTEEKDKAAEYTLGTAVRVPIVRHGKVELEILGSVNLAQQVENPTGSNNTIKTTAIGLGWGVGITYWYSRHWCLSFSAGNPLLTFTTTAREQPSPLMDTSSSTLAIGAIFDPTVAIMIHLFN